MYLFIHCYIHSYIATQVKNQSYTQNFTKAQQNLCEWERSQGKATTYILKFEKKVLEEGVIECNVKTPPLQKGLLSEKVVMVVGATGKGKSTLINRMINHIFGVNYTDKFRFQLIVEQNSSQIESQTKLITKYTICNGKFDFILSVIDTPGFGDTTGREADKATIQKIHNLFKSGTIVSINAICFVANYNDSRLTEYEQYIFENVAKVFGNDVSNNIFIMTTCCDEFYEDDKIKESIVVQHFKKLNIPFKNSFPFNNKSIYDEPKKAQAHRDQWETSTISYDLFFEELKKTFPVSLLLAKKVLQRQEDIILVHMPMFIKKLQQSISTFERHREVLKQLQEWRDLPDENFRCKLPMEKMVMVDIQEAGIFAIVCSNCSDKVCHYPCDVPRNKEIKECSVMRWKLFGRDECSVCQNKCPWTEHRRIKQRPDIITVYKDHTMDELEREYSKQKKVHQDKKEKWEEIVKSCEKEMVSTYEQMLQDLKTAQDNIDFLNEKCLVKNLFTLEKIISEITENESKLQKEGYTKRRKILENLISILQQKKNKKENNNAADIFTDFKNALSEEDKLLQAKKLFYKI